MILIVLPHNQALINHRAEETTDLLCVFLARELILLKFCLVFSPQDVILQLIVMQITQSTARLSWLLTGIESNRIRIISKLVTVHRHRRTESCSWLFVVGFLMQWMGSQSWCMPPFHDSLLPWVFSVTLAITLTLKHFLCVTFSLLT